MANRIFIGDVVFYLAIGFLAGALVAGLGWRLGPFIAFNFAGAVIFFVVAKRFLKRVRAMIAAIFLFGSLSGFIYYFVFIKSRAAKTDLPIGQAVTFSAVITSEPKLSNKYLIMTAKAEPPFAGEFTIFAPPGSGFEYGDEASVAGKVEAPKAAGETPAIFPTAKKIRLIGEHRGSWLHENLITFKSAVLAKFRQVLSWDKAALLNGELFGGTEGMSQPLKDAMAASDTLYIVSMYGYKIAMLIFVLEAMFAEWIPRRIRFALLVAAAWLLVALAGGNISAVRAAIMATLSLVAKLAGRAFDGRHALALTAATMALFDPTLPAQASFQLSVFSLAGIFYLADPLKIFFGWGGQGAGWLAWREAVIIAIATLLPIIPIIAISFGDFSLTAFPSNVLISFGVLPAMAFGAILATIGFLVMPLATVVAQAGGIILAYQLFIVRIFASFAVSLPIPFTAPVIFVGYYAALMVFTHYYRPDQFY